MKIYKTPNCVPIVFDELGIKQNFIDIETLDDLSSETKYVSIKDIEYLTTKYLDNKKQNPDYTDGTLEDVFPSIITFETKYLFFTFSIKLGFILSEHNLIGIVCREGEKYVGYMVEGSYPFVKKLLKIMGIPNKNIIILNKNDFDAKFMFPVTIQADESEMKEIISSKFIEKLQEIYSKRITVDILNKFIDYFIPEDYLNSDSYYKEYRDKDIFIYAGPKDESLKLQGGEYVRVQDVFEKYLTIRRVNTYGDSGSKLYIVRRTIPLNPLTFLNYIRYLQYCNVLKRGSDDIINLMPEKIRNTYIFDLKLEDLNNLKI